MTFKTRFALLAPLALVAMTGGCGKKADEGKVQAAGGEVLPGTVSDAMLDLDHSQAEAPLQAVQPSGAAKAAKAPVEEASADAAAADVAEPAPAVSPAPTASASPKPAASAKAKTAG
ncbi:hypothetical protein OLX02_05570 [Novosphingobium sp. KCTC 2891]|uniref:hypothetical protein n=1 Tax=Novosphingobium sp. KCTC 2891 TaxID=2989730 RepID=UPI002223DF49|nr:hypothetical protein [Novosphingobium sp. KCTC 2891]MCW1382284.1 hypothetical protein [Novosphingobium sp. KCTC 2891]